MKKTKAEKLTIKKSIAKKRGEKRQKRKEVRKRHIEHRNMLMKDIERKREQEARQYYEKLMGM